MSFGFDEFCGLLLVVFVSLMFLERKVKVVVVMCMGIYALVPTTESSL